MFHIYYNFSFPFLYLVFIISLSDAFRRKNPYLKGASNGYFDNVANTPLQMNSVNKMEFTSHYEELTISSLKG